MAHTKPTCEDVVGPHEAECSTASQILAQHTGD